MKRIFILKPTDIAGKREALALIGAATKPMRVEVCEYRARRTDRQNRMYWPAMVVPFAQWLAQQYGTAPDEDRAHQVFKDTFLRVPESDADGGVIFGLDGNPMMRTRSTTELDIGEFTIYMDQCRGLLLELCHIVVPAEFGEAA